MDTLLNPDKGLLIWTVVTFVVLVFVLAKSAWKPILNGLEARENRIKTDLDRAEQAHKEAEALRIQYETQLAEAQKNVQSMVAQAKADAEKTKSELLAEAKTESDRIIERGRKELDGEAERLKTELRGDVANLSVQIAEKLLNRSVDSKIQQQVLKDSLSRIEGLPK